MKLTKREREVILDIEALESERASRSDQRTQISLVTPEEVAKHSKLEKPAPTWKKYSRAQVGLPGVEGDSAYAKNNQELGKDPTQC